MAVKKPGGYRALKSVTVLLLVLVILSGALCAQLRAYRASEVHGNAYRRPGKYGLLTETRIQAPFVRPDYRP